VKIKGMLIPSPWRKWEGHLSLRGGNEKVTSPSMEEMRRSPLPPWRKWEGHLSLHGGNGKITILLHFSVIYNSVLWFTVLFTLLGINIRESLCPTKRVWSEKNVKMLGPIYRDGIMWRHKYLVAKV
jgi:hypothetical protein